MAQPKLMVEIDGEAGGLFSIVAKVQEKLQALQQGSDSLNETARRSMGTLEQGARAAAQALRLAEEQVATIQAKLRAGGGSGPDPAAAMARLNAAQTVNAQMQAQYHAAQQTLGQASVMTWLRQANSTEAATQALRTHAQALNQVDQRAQVTNGSLFQVGASLMAIRAALQALHQIASASLEADLSLERAQRTLQMATGDSTRGMAFLKRIAQELGLELGTLADGYAMMAASAKGTSMEGVATEKVFYSVARAASALSLSGDATHGVILALSQMMSKGKVMAEELRKQLGEHLPGAASIAARAMGVTGQELNRMLIAGEVLSADFLPRFAKELDKTLGDAPERAAQSLQGNINRIKSSFQLLSYEVGQAGAGGKLSQGLGELASAMNSPEGIAAAKEMSQTLGTILSSAKSTTLTMWELRAPILAVGSAWLSIKALQIGKAVFDWGAAKVVLAQQSLAVRQALIQEALASAGATYASGQNALVQVQNAQASVAATLAKFESAVAAGNLTVAEANATRAAIAHTQAKLAEAAAIAGTSATARAGAAAMGGAFGIVTLAVGLLAAGYMLLSNRAEEARKKQEEALQAIKGSGESLKKTKDLRDEFVEISKALEAGTVKADGLKYANERLKAIQNQLILQHPELKKVLEEDKNAWGEQRAAIDAASDAEERNLQLKRARLEADAKAAEERAKTAETERQRILALPASARERAGRYGERFDQTGQMLAPSAASLAQATAEAQALRTQIAAIDEIFKAAPPPGPREPVAPDKKDLSGIITAEEIRARLATMRAESEERVTLEQQKQHALDEAEAKYLHEAAEITKQAREGKFDGNQAGVDALWTANIQRLKARQANIEAEYDAKRLKMAADVQAKMTAMEEGGLDKRLEAVRKEFVGIREENTKLAKDGVAPYTEAQIQAAETAATARARLDQIKQDLGKLKTELSELAQMKGGPLSTGEIVEVMKRFAATSTTAAEAVKKLKQELHLGEGAAEGWAAGMNQVLVNLGNRYERWKNANIQLLNTNVNAFATFFTSIVSHGQTAAQKWDALWKGISGSVVQALTRMGAEELVHWGLLKAKEAWDTWRSGKKKVDTAAEVLGEGAKATAAATAETAKTAAVLAGAAVTTPARIAETAATTVLTTAVVELAAAETWAAYASMPFVGAGLAMGQIAVMLESLAALSTMALGAKVVGAAEGAWFDRPTLTVMGEGLQRELAVPEVSFTVWAGNLANNILYQERQAQAYNRQAAGYANATQAAGGGGRNYFDLRGSVFMGESAETDRLIGDRLNRLLRDRDRRNP